MKEIDYLKVGKKLKILRSKAGYTQEVLAEKCGISTSFLGHIERGTKKLSLETAVRIADCLNVSVDYLIVDGLTYDNNWIPIIDAILKTQSAENQRKIVAIFKILGENADRF